MNPIDPEIARRLASIFLDVLIRAALVLAMVMLCYRIFAPFLTMMAWALILAVTLFPLHQSIASRLGGRQGLAAILLVLLVIALIAAPTAILVMSIGDSVHSFITGLQTNTIVIPPPREAVRNWPLIGTQAYAFWSQAHSDLPALVHNMQPKIGELARGALGVVAGLGGEMLKFPISFIIAGIIMAFGHAGSRSINAIFRRIAGDARGSALTKLSTATVRAVALGVVGVAFIQALLIGLCLIVAGVPLPGVLALIVLILGIAQVPALVVSLPAIAWIWSRGEYSSTLAIAYTVLLLVAGMADNVLKPMLLGRGVDAPMPIILLGALGGMASGGILGMFVGATLFALGYQIFMLWVSEADPNMPLREGIPPAPP
ncbi:AI-2E family transporter [Roseococcus pinisoli]|uniref:AI-2E family transporter n=1 Tax=Roseococcus pinisoli TaxID=2835040 RepID=A0ABS5QII4_9PROT|nr:AI-2E family transporter [Roseococcus pinisoli]MBS7813392.1 AI-2E family transporter [Roseococcus pinisoli]